MPKKLTYGEVRETFERLGNSPANLNNSHIFDPERVTRLSRNNAMEPPGLYVRADDYDRLLALYRELKREHSLEGIADEMRKPVHGL